MQEDGLEKAFTLNDCVQLKSTHLQHGMSFSSKR